MTSRRRPASARGRARASREVRRETATSAVGLVLFLLGALGCAEQARPEPALGLVDCRLPGTGEAFRCGRLEVPENRTAPSGRKIELHVAVLGADGDRPDPDPIFLLAGGPGQAASEAFGPMLPALSSLRGTRDLVLVDQRGTGRSGALECPSDPSDLAIAFRDDQVSKAARRCLGTLDADLGAYTTPYAAADLDDVREALGYESINLIGGSYGTRLALVYLRQYGSRVRSMVLDGAVPTDMALPLSFARDTDRSLNRLFEDCRTDATCAAAFPLLESDFSRVHAKLSGSALNVSVMHPRSGQIAHVEVTRDAFAGMVRALLYVPELSALLPLAVRAAAAGDLAKLVAEAAVLIESSEEMLSLGLFLSVICTEDVPRISDADIRRETQGTLLGERPARELGEACRTWPKGELPEGFFEPVRSQAPVLILSGDLDPATPPSLGEAVARHLEQSRHVVVPGASHGTLARGAVPDLVSDFIETPNPAALDVSRVARQRRPPFLIDLAGPPH